MHFNVSFTYNCIVTYIQVLSSSVAKALEYYRDPATKETQRFCQIFDRFFDCLNVRSYSEGRKKRKPDLLPYRTIADTCFKVSCMQMCFTLFINIQFSFCSGLKMTFWDIWVNGIRVYLIEWGSLQHKSNK